MSILQHSIKEGTEAGFKGLALFVITLLYAGIASAGPWMNSNTLLAKAQPDECYAGIGVPYPELIPTTPPSCPAGSEPKVNQVYAWGTTEEEGAVWVGTGANVHCGTLADFVDGFGFISTYYGMSVYPLETENNVCEFDQSQSALLNPAIGNLGDARPPKVWQYDIAGGTLTDRTPDGTNSAGFDPNIELVKGMRSAGSHNGVVFMAGGSLTGSVIAFAWDAIDGTYLGSQVFSGYKTIRKWAEINGKYYTAVQKRGSGRIVKWTGSYDHDTHNASKLWEFMEVGKIDGSPRELTEYIDNNGKSRIAVNSGGGLFISPIVPMATGLKFWHKWGWKKVWDPELDYEPSALALLTYGAGGVEYFDGWLFFSTVQVSPGLTVIAEPGSLAEELIDPLWRATSIWRAKDLETSAPVIELLYGEEMLMAPNAEKEWVLTPNVGGYIPKHGSSGFGNTYNNYAWVMAKIEGHLLVATLDNSSYSSPDAPSINGYGGDLWSFSSADAPAVLEDGTGLGNPLNYGIRTLFRSDDGTKLYAGTAMADNLGEDAGWELRELSSVP